MAQRRFAWFVRDPAFYKKLALIALPVAGQNVIGFGVGLIGNLMVSHLGEGSVGGIFVANQIQGIYQMLIMGLGAALVMLAAQYYGKKDVKSVKVIISFSVQMAAGVGLVLFFIMTFFGRSVLGIISDADSVIAESLVYMSYLRWSFILFGLTSVLLAAMRCAGNVNIGFATSLIAFLSNLLFSYIFIYGNFGAPEMGVAGAGLAVLLSRVLEFCIVVFYVLRIDKKIRYAPKDLLLRNKLLSLDYFRYGLPLIAGDFTWGLGNMAKASIIGRLGESVIAANAIVGNLGTLFAIFVYGIATAGSLTVGQVIGNNDFETAKNYTKTLQIVYPCIGIISSAIMIAMRGPALSIYEYQALTPQTIMHCNEIYTILCITLIGTSYQMATLQIVRAGGAPHFVFVNDLIFVWLVMIPMALIANTFFNAPPWFIIFSLNCDQILKCGVAAVKANRFRWMKNLTRQEALG